MAGEIVHDAEISLTLYACRFLLNGNAFLSNPATNEVWGTGGRDADDYDITVPETTVGESGHYEGDFADGGSIAAGDYYVTIYQQLGGSPANSDKRVARGMIHWDGTAEITLTIINNRNRQRVGPFK